MDTFLPCHEQQVEIEHDEKECNRVNGDSGYLWQLVVLEAEWHNPRLDSSLDGSDSHGRI